MSDKNSPDSKSCKLEPRTASLFKTFRSVSLLDLTVYPRFDEVFFTSPPARNSFLFKSKRLEQTERGKLQSSKLLKSITNDQKHRFLISLSTSSRQVFDKLKTSLRQAQDKSSTLGLRREFVLSRSKGLVEGFWLLDLI